jgi:hypothetical protein
MKKFFKSFLLSFFLCLPVMAAKPHVAVVMKMRGTATKLVPGAWEATKVEEGDKFIEDTSILTGPKSFIKLKFIDNSEMSIGPESKIVISQMSAKEPGIISLLKGRIRTEVQKENGQEAKENKFYIRTRTAALGIRGTDFQTIYNPENKMTSLLTFNGAVAMAKVDETTHQKIENAAEDAQKEIVRENNETTPEVKTIPGKPLNEQEELKKVLAKSETVIVPPGQNAFSSDSLKKSSLPVKISPVQLNALYKNRDFEEKSQINLKSGNEVDLDKIKVVQAPQVAPAEGIYNSKTGDFAPKAGGFIDLSTGLYVAPAADAILDKEKGVYTSTKSGDIDAETGDYFAPKGLKLDAKKGFVVEQEANAQPELLALREDMNKSIARDVVVGTPKDETRILVNVNEKYIRDRVSLTLGMGQEEINVNEDSSLVPAFKLTAQDVFKADILWEMAARGRLTALLGISFSNVDYDNVSNITQDSSALFSMQGGIEYALSKTIDLRTKLQLNQNHFVEQGANNTFLLKRIVLTRWTIGAKGEFFDNGTFSLLTEADFSTSFRKRFNNDVVDSGTGFEFRIMPRWAISEREKIGFGFHSISESNKISNSFGSNEQDRRISSIEVQYAREF